MEGFNLFTGQETVGSVVAAFPGAGNVFKRHGIDFCCGGNRRLETIIRQQELDGVAVLMELNDAWTRVNGRIEGVDWRQATSKELVDEIVTRHHDYLREELPLLSEFTSKILRVHGPHHAETLEPLHRYFHQLKEELDSHLAKEETELFPLILAHEANPTEELFRQASEKLEELEREHEAAGDLLRSMREVTDNYTLPEGACRTYQLTFRKLEELESDLFRHIHLENNILFLRYTAETDCGCEG